MCVTVVGLGGVGSHAAQLLAHANASLERRTAKEQEFASGEQFDSEVRADAARESDAADTGIS